MEKRIVQFKGMTNVPDDGINEAGDMSVLLNMRHKGGELVQCQQPDNIPNMGEVKKALFHQYSNKWIILRKDGSLKAYKKDFSDASNPVVLKDDGVESFALSGNVVVMNIENETEYALWRGGEPELLGRLPQIPKMTVRIAEKTVASQAQSYYGGLEAAQTAGSEDLWEGYNRKGRFNVCLDELYASGAYIDLAFFRLALKLFDGTYKVLSPVYIVNGVYGSNPVMGKNNFRWTDTMKVAQDNYIAEVSGFIPSFSIEEYNFKKWEDVVSSVCLFTSGSLPMHKLQRGVPVYMLDKLISRPYDDYLITSAEQYKEAMSDVSYYKIAEYDLKGTLLNSLENTSPSSLANQDVLSLKTAVDYAGLQQEEKNSRLHSFSSVLLYPNGYAGLPNYINEEYTPLNFKIAVKTYLKMENGEIEVVAEEMNEDVGVVLPNLLTYPNRNAYRIDVYASPVANNLSISGVKVPTRKLYYKSFDLEKNDYSAFYIAEDLWRINDVKIDSSLSYNIKIANKVWAIKEFGSGTHTFTYNEKGWWGRGVGDTASRIHASTFFEISGTPTGGDSFKVKIEQPNPKTFIKTSNFESYAENLVERFKDAEITWDKYEVDGVLIGVNVADFTILKGETTGKEKELNVLRVSELNNPFVFPESQAYRFDGDIVAIASNAEAISTGQFGQYPLFVFTTEGIWAMQVDSTGKTAYSTQTPFSREVCNGAVCALSGGVAFTTDRGVMMISGGQVVNLSAVLDAPEAELLEYSNGLVTEIFKQADDKLTSVENLKPVPIRQYLKEENGAKLAYNYLANELIVSNKAYGFSYVYGFNSQTWSMIGTTFDVVTNSYPELVVFDGDNCGVMYEFKDGEGANKVVAITRPFTLGSFDYKRLRQAALRTTFTGSLNFYLLGSNDGANFVCITGKEYPSKNGGESMNVTRRDLITAMSRSKQYKYFAIAIAGNMKGRVSLAELLVDAGFANNKLR